VHQPQCSVPSWTCKVGRASSDALSSQPVSVQLSAVSDVLDLKYMPSNPTEAQMFDAQQNYIYVILLNTVKDSFLKSIVFNHNNRKVQECWEKIIAACEASTLVEIKANSLLQYITSVKFDDGKWMQRKEDVIDVAKIMISLECIH